MKLYFHGTDKSNLSSILNKGLLVKYGRANFTTNPLYSASYSSKKTWGTTMKLDIKPVINEGMILVFNDLDNDIKVAKDSNIIFNKKEKIISGWPNRFKTEQFGYFKRKNLPKNYLVAAFSFSKDLFSILETINKSIISGKINEDYIKKSANKIEKILKKSSIINSNVSLMLISESMVYGMIRNLVLREIRTCYISHYSLNSWKIINNGDHPVKLKDKKEINKTLKNIKKIINKKFISSDVRNEFVILNNLIT